MSETQDVPEQQAKLIARLSAELHPVRRLASPWRRAVAWLAAAAWAGLLVSLFGDWGAFCARLMSAPDMWISELGAALTGALAAWAAFQTAIPGRSPLWALLPLPALALWVGASTLGCLRTHPLASVTPETAMHPMVCLEFLVLIAAPLSALLTWQVMRAFPLRPGLTAALGGLASAGAAATLLALIHPFDATADDLLVHAVAVGGVILATRFAGERAIERATSPAPLPAGWS